MRGLFSAAALVLVSGAGVAGPDVTVPEFSAINAHAGADVMIHYGKTQRVAVIKGDLKRGHITVKDGRTLDISGCDGFCMGTHSLKVEVTVPRLDSVIAHSGGSAEADGNFPKVPKLYVKAHSGGDVDVMAMPADFVEVEAHSGGDAKVTALNTLKARAHSGGDVTYKGHPPHVDASTNSGGDINGE